jgi:hypothetical protein
MAQLDLNTYMPEKNLKKKKNPAACGSGTNSVFPKKSKKAEKRTLSSCKKLKFRFHEK